MLPRKCLQVCPVLYNVVICTHILWGLEEAMRECEDLVDVLVT